MQIQPPAMTSKCCNARVRTKQGMGWWCSHCNRRCEAILADTGKKANPTPTQDGQTRELLRLASLVGTDAKNPEANLLAYIAALCTERERLARIDEVDRIPNPAYIGIDGKRIEPFITYKRFRLAELQQQSSSHGQPTPTLGEKLLSAIELSGNEFAMGYDDSGCYWHFHAGKRGNGRMMFGEVFMSGIVDIEEALDQYLEFTQQQSSSQEDNDQTT